MEATQDKEENFFKEILKASLIALIIVVPIRIYVAQPFIVSGASMDPTLGSGHYLVVDQLSFRFNEPERGDVVIFKYPKNPSKFFVKRIIGLPGETVSAKNGQVIIFNAYYPDGALLDEGYVEDGRLTADTFKTILADDEYFVMGDNRAQSSDSRMWGPVQRDLIVGRAFLRVLPITKISVLPGDYPLTF